MRYWLFALSCCLLAACDGQDEAASTAPAADVATVQLALSFPVEEGEATRGPGDPGDAESLDAPTYAYIWFVDNKENVQRLQYKDENNVLQDVPTKVELADFFGTPATENYTGSLSTSGDQVHRFPIRELQMNSDWSPGRFYVAASNQPLKQGDTPIENVNPTTESQVLALTFDLYDDDMKADLKNIYSTPYNYNISTPATYYGTWTTATNMINLMLYHVAARVDVKWNVTNDKSSNFQATRKVKTMDIEGTNQLKATSCLLFKPMENSSLGTSAYSKQLKTAGEVGRQWYGRSSFYTIPYKEGDYFKLDLKVDDGAASDAVHTTTVQLNMKGANTVFVPWIRVNLTYDEEADFTQPTLTLD